MESTTQFDRASQGDAWRDDRACSNDTLSQRQGWNDKGVDGTVKIHES